MAWDSSRTVPWQRLARESLIYAAIITVIFLVLFRDQNVVGLIGGVLASGPLYLGLGYVLAKLGYQRKTLKEMRTPRAGVSTPETLTEDSRGRPAPTRRTTTGPSNRPRAKKRR